MTKNKSNKRLDHSAQPNMFGMIQNVLMTGIRTGHTVFVILALIVIIFILGLDSTHKLSMFNNFLNFLTEIYILGWILFFLMLLYTWFTFKKLRRKHQQELNRISKEKSMWQERALKKRLKSTER